MLTRGVITKETVDSYPKEQLVFLALKDYYDVCRDDLFKLFYLPFNVARDRFDSTNEQLKKDRQRLGWFTGLTYGMLPSIDAFHTAQTRAKQRIALIQAIEAIRMAGAANGGKLIESLDAAPVPVPNDPFTGKPFAYQVVGNVATLSSEYPSTWPARIELKFAK